MRLRFIKMTFATLWVLAAVIVGIAANVTSPGGVIALCGFGLLPPLGVLLLWNDPAQTLSESIREGRR